MLASVNWLWGEYAMTRLVQMLALAVTVAAVVPVAGCASADQRPEGVVVERVEFRGWADAVRMSNGETEVVVVPQIARIMAYRTVGGENVLWVNDELAPDTAAADADTDPNQWQNFGGYKLWPAPQKDWGWPPDPSLDRGSCEVAISEDGAVSLIGKPSTKHGIRFDREFRLDPTGSRLQITQTATNVSDETLTASIWEVTQVKDDCVGFVPLGPGCEYRTGDGGPPDAQWTRLGSMAFVRPVKISGKVFFSGGSGYLGCKRAGQIYLKAFEMPADPPPEPETPREVYTGDMGYIELEVVGPGVELAPGESTSNKIDWYLLPVGPEAEGDEGLAASVAKLVEQLPEP
jgi:hypothetical protein